MEGVATKLLYRATTLWVECGSSLLIFRDVTGHSTRRFFSDKNLTRYNHDRHRGDYIGTPILRVVKHLSRRGRRKRNKRSELVIVVEEEEESRKRNVVVVVGKQQWKYNEAFFFLKKKTSVLTVFLSLENTICFQACFVRKFKTKNYVKKFGSWNTHFIFIFELFLKKKILA